MSKYIVSRDSKSGAWYAHMDGYSYIPVTGSISESKRIAMEYAKLYNGKPNQVQEIEDARRAEFEKMKGGNGE